MEYSDSRRIKEIRNNTAKMADAFTRIADVFERLADRKTENCSGKPNNCEDKPQTCYTCEYEWRDGTDEPCVYCYGGSKYKPKDEPQKHCHRPNNVACHPEQGDMWCRGCDYWYANEPQTERGSE